MCLIENRLMVNKQATDTLFSWCCVDMQINLYAQDFKISASATFAASPKQKNETWIMIDYETE